MTCCSFDVEINQRYRNGFHRGLNLQGQTSGVDEDPRLLLLKVLEELPNACGPQAGGRGTESAALLRTTALHLYSWRATEQHGVGHTRSLTSAAVVSSEAGRKAADERRAETLLTRAVEIEPFHVPTIAALAFVLLQRCGGGDTGDCCAKARAERLFEKAIACSCGRGEFSAPDFFAGAFLLSLLTGEIFLVTSYFFILFDVRADAIFLLKP